MVILLAPLCATPLAMIALVVAEDVRIVGKAAQTTDVAQALEEAWTRHSAGLLKELVRIIGSKPVIDESSLVDVVDFIGFPIRASRLR